MDYHKSMISTVTGKNMVSIPVEVGRVFSIKPGFKLEWKPVPGKDEILVRVIPDRATLSRRLLGAGKGKSAGVDSVKQLVKDRESER
jgi:bifunctional DNA-binding transcriptional regulator/antitoxin component of YhaV-PrlF toxin-antitoxin module